MSDQCGGILCIKPVDDNVPKSLIAFKLVHDPTGAIPAEDHYVKYSNIFGPWSSLFLVQMDWPNI